MTGHVASDKLQTNAGRSFWQNRLTEAFRKQLDVYFYDESTNPSSLIKLFNKSEISNLVNKDQKLWGTNADYQKHRLIISTERIVPTGNGNVNLED